MEKIKPKLSEYGYWEIISTHYLFLMSFKDRKKKPYSSKEWKTGNQEQKKNTEIISQAKIWSYSNLSILIILLCSFYAIKGRVQHIEYIPKMNHIQGIMPYSCNAILPMINKYHNKRIMVSPLSQLHSNWVWSPQQVNNPHPNHNQNFDDGHKITSICCHLLSNFWESILSHDTASTIQSTNI